MKKKFRLFFVVLVIAGMLLASCAPAVPETAGQVTDLEAQIAALQADLEAAKDAAVEAGKDIDVGEVGEELQAQLDQLQCSPLLKRWPAWVCPWLGMFRSGRPWHLLLLAVAQVLWLVAQLRLHMVL